MRLERRFVFGLLVVKLLFLAWNVALFDGTNYDAAHHLWRLKSAGFTVSKMAYNGPLYYMPAGPYELFADAGLVPSIDTRIGQHRVYQIIRTTNLVMLAVLYGSWIYGILPRVTRDERTWFAASMVLLCLPGYQKVGTLVHPDNMLAAGTAACFALWLWVREREEHRTRWEFVLAVSIGVLGSVRPFAVVPILVIWACLMVSSRVGRTLRAWLPRALAMSAISGVLAGAWLGYRAIAADVVLDAYSNRYLEPYIEHREDFDYVEYSTTFYLPEILRVPNRRINRLYKGDNDKFHNPYGNSFFTTAYSEFWGDHWLYLSGPSGKEEKLFPKQMLLATALPMTLALLGRLLWGLALVGGGAVTSVRQRASANDPETSGSPTFVHYAMTVILVTGLILYLYWQSGPALTPGKNSSIKFLYNAHLVPFGIALAFLQPVRWHWAWGAGAVLLTVVSWPYLLFVPTWW